jgi:hypothetical protein
MDYRRLKKMSPNVLDKLIKTWDGRKYKTIEFAMEEIKRLSNRINYSYKIDI